jgi:hypothetical protein
VPIQNVQGIDLLNTRSSEETFSIFIPVHLTVKQKHLILALKFLDAGANWMRCIKINSILLNFESMVFAISWFGLVCFCELRRSRVKIKFPESSFRFFWVKLRITQVFRGVRNSFYSLNYLELNNGCRQAGILGLPISECLVERLSNNPMLFDHICSLFHFCVSVSPLFALTSRSFEQSTIRRSYLISVSLLLINLP